ncbi:MAG: GAF domain-containing protein [Chloroflexi bacterium]|nr:GAF domain-containing protein [Chloroflexota bacterium]
MLSRSSQSVDELLETLTQKKGEPENLHDTLQDIVQMAKRRLLRYQEVARIGHEINHDLATAAIVFGKLKKGVPEIVDTQHALLLAIHQPQTDTIELHLEEEGHPLFYDHVQGGACKYVMETQKPVFIKNLSKEVKELPFQIMRIEDTAPKESFIFVPLILHEVSLGVLSVQHPQAYAYTQEDLSILQLLANHVALALHNIRQYDTLRRLYETGQLLTQQLDSGFALQATIEKIHEATQADLAILHVYETTRCHSVSPPVFAGRLLNATSYQFLHSYQPENITDLLFQQTSPLFAAEKQGIFCQSDNSSVQMWQSQFLRREEIRSTAILPLQVGVEVIGALFIHFRKQQRFDDLQRLFIEGLAPYASIAIRNASAFNTLHQSRRHDLKTLQNIDRELNQVLDLKHVFTRLLELACERVPADGASIWLAHPHTGTLELVAGIHSHGEGHLLQRTHLQNAHGITQWVAQHKKSARVANVHRDRPWCDLYVQIMPGTISELDVPILDEGEVIGVLNFESTRPGAFHQNDEEFLHTLAGQAVLAIRKAQAYEREKRLTEEGRVLNDVSKEIIGQLENHNQVFDLILKKALELTGSKTGVLMLYDAERNDLWMAAEQGVFEEKKGQRHGLDQGIVGLVARTKKLLNVDLTQPPWNKLYLDYIPYARCELAVPMLNGNELRGVLNIESTSPDKFAERDERLLEGLADLAVVALQQTQLYQKAKNGKNRFSLLYQAAASLSKIREIEHLERAYDIVLNMAILNMAAKYELSQIVICRYDHTAKQLVLKRHYPSLSPVEQMDWDQEINEQVIREQCTIWIDDSNHLSSDRDESILTGRSNKSFLVVPICFKDHLYGILGMSYQEVSDLRDTDKDTDRKFFEGLAQQLASTIYRLDSEQRAQELETLSAIGHFAFELTHRWDNSLGLVESHVNNIEAELARMGADNGAINRQLGYIRQGVQKVLDWSQALKLVASSGSAIDRFEITPIEVLFGELQEQIGSLCPQTIHVETQIDDDIEGVEIIPRLINDCLRNLITNAIDAMPQGGHLLLHARNTETGVAIDVTDTGIGIAEDMQAKIFQLFFSTKGSSGFGLWSARTNALKNHGTLEVKSSPGEGATFTLLLPEARRHES